MDLFWIILTVISKKFRSKKTFFDFGTKYIPYKKLSKN